MTARLEDVIKARIAEQRFDDVERVEPMLDSLSNRGGRKGPELDDQKSKRGLGDVYADEFVKQREAAAGRVSAVEEKEEPLAAEARALFKALNVKLDALSHFHFTPKPIVEDIAVKVDAPALEVEEVAPAMASEASRKAPEEVFAGGGGAGGTRGSAAGAVKADGELTKEDRKASRAKRKRKAKAVGQERERDQDEEGTCGRGKGKSRRGGRVREESAKGVYARGGARGGAGQVGFLQVLKGVLNAAGGEGRGRGGVGGRSPRATAPRTRARSSCDFKSFSLIITSPRTVSIRRFYSYSEPCMLPSLSLTYSSAHKCQRFASFFENLQYLFPVHNGMHLSRRTKPLGLPKPFGVPNFSPILIEAKRDLLHL